MMTESTPPEGVPAPSRGRSRRRSLVLSLVALLVLMGAGASIWRTAGEDIRRMVADARAAWRQSPAPPGRPSPALPDPELARQNRPLTPEDSAYWSEVTLFRAGPTRPRPVVVVHRASWSGSEATGSLPGLITREIFRQGFIMSLREGTDAVVRDRMTGDPDEPGTPDATARFGSLLQAVNNRRPDDPLGGRLTVVTGEGPDRRVLLHRYLKIPIQNAPQYAAVVWRVEELIAEEFPKALASWDLPPSRMPRTAIRPEALPDGVAAQIASLSEYDQIIGLRALHEAVREQGASVARLFALAHGYALLGSLTEPLPSACHAAFKARALLYAQRGFNGASKAPRSFRDQAYAEALAGFIKEAKIDVAGAQKADGGQGATPHDEAIRAYLSLDLDRLNQLVEQAPNDPLPIYLAAIVAQRALDGTSDLDHNCRHEIIEAQDRLLARYPDCNRAINALCEAQGVNNLHRATLLGVQSFAAATARRVQNLPGLDPAVREQARNEKAGPAEVALRRAIDSAAVQDRGDLTWGTQALILRETRFWQVARRIYFEAAPLGSSPQAFARMARPLLADHPNQEFLDLFTGQLDPMSAAKLFRRLDWDGCELKNRQVLSFGGYIHDRQLSSKLWTHAWHQSDLGLIPNTERQIRTNESNRLARARSLMRQDPDSPLARAVLAELDWKGEGAKALVWEREQPWNTMLKVQIGFQLLEEKRYAEAQERFEVALGRSPEAWIFGGLARAYSELGQTETYLRAAQAMLQQPDQDLDHASIADGLARHLINQGQVDEAWPWTERAAESWANFAMSTAWRCAEMRRDWTNAELWVSRQSQRYGHEWLNWLHWCLRTGHGQTQEAAQLVWAQVDAGRVGRDTDEDVLIACFGLLTERADVTRAITERFLAETPHSASHLYLLALACDRLGDRKARDEALDRIVSDPKPSGPRTARATRLLLDWNRHRDEQPLAEVLTQVDAVLAEIPVENRPNTAAVIGGLLYVFRQPTEALPYLRQADSGQCRLGIRLVARRFLTDQDAPVVDFLFDPPTPESKTSVKVE